MSPFKKQNDIITFFVGLVMLCVGGYLFLQNVEVDTYNIFSFAIAGRRMDGLLFFPLIASIIFIFFKYNTISKTCLALSIILIIVNVIINLRLYWHSLSLFGTIIIFILLFGGAAILAKIIFANPDGDHGKNYRQ